MWSLGIAKTVPLTLVNEHGSSMMAKVHIAEEIQKQISNQAIYRKNLEVLSESVGVAHMQTFQSQDVALSQVSQKGNMTALTSSLMDSSGVLNPDTILRKGIYDKVAATIILQKYLNFHNDPEAEFIVDETHSDKF